MNNNLIDAKIHDIINQNKIDDLTRFLEKRQCLNRTNVCLTYLFHIVQSAGIFTTTLAAGYNIKELVWGGIALNIIASLIHTFEQTNNTLSKRLMKDIVAIKQGKYVDEGLSVEPEKSDTAGADTSKPSAKEVVADTQTMSMRAVAPETPNLSEPLLDGSV